jgi:hypothetical protein
MRHMARTLPVPSEPSVAQCSVHHVQDIKGDWELFVEDSKKNPLTERSRRSHDIAAQQVRCSQTSPAGLGQCGGMMTSRISRQHWESSCRLRPCSLTSSLVISLSMSDCLLCIYHLLTGSAQDQRPHATCLLARLDTQRADGEPHTGTPRSSCHMQR